MKVYRMKKKEVKFPRVGDKIKVDVDGEKQWATCMGYDYIGNPVFLFDNILTELPHDEAEKYCQERGWFLPNKQQFDKWVLIRDARHRIANSKGSPYSAWWWLANKVGKDCFALVGNDGVVACCGASGSGGVRPAFYLKGDTINAEIRRFNRLGKAKEAGLRQERS